MKRCKLLSVLIMAVMITCMYAAPVHASSKISLNTEYQYLEVGESYQLKITGTTKTVKWISSDKSIVTVDKNGEIKGNSVGDANITAKVGSKKFVCEVYVIEQKADYNVEITENNIELTYSPSHGYSTIQPIITYYDEKGKELATTEFTNHKFNPVGVDIITTMELPECDYSYYEVDFVVTLE